ncbi:MULTISPECIES: hypothetical protein [Pseudomonas]|uniref:Uncharacterized protein n=1 Tax=Pseudomonas idahonensis TaxID=2942628 RepID=A0ABT5Q1S4_9PSED|nr:MULTISPECIES: hypothetical protein [Pseudomonas]MCO7577336.1 hypothetical protein [Pseudomonas protegens]MCO7583948.1 hypothetical protein [Pseudomonas chlororaphis]MCO7600719.1 hypothetical protein [Pseudomonas chlororaphis]MDC7815683.1 hypothetical protein [Pseudomonas sp. BLCC-B112]MDD1017422.1 hypothetical protein [Pseudomonas idahonensis]
MQRIQTITPCLWFDYKAQMMCATDPSRSQRVMQALLGMKKIDIDQLQRAFDGKS